MGEASRTLSMEELMIYSVNLLDILKDGKENINLKYFRLQANTLQSQCRADFVEIQNSIEDYEKKIHACKLKAAAEESENAADSELDLLQKELEEEQNLERMLREELREIICEIDDLEDKRESVEEQRQSIRKFEQDELRAPMKLSMCASVTKIIPYLDDPSRISGNIVERDKNVAVEKFEFDPSKVTSFEICNNIWKMINLS